MTLIEELAPQEAGPAPPPPEALALEDAARRGHVTFHQVAGAWYRANDPAHGDEAEHFRRVFPKLLQVFGDQRGGVISAYFCHNISVAAALTDISAASKQEGEIAPKPMGGAPVAPTSPGGLRATLSPMAMLGRMAGGRRAIAAVSTEHASNTAIHLEPVFGHPNDAVAKDILFQCIGLHYRALEFLRPKARKICIRMIFNLVVALLGTMDARVQDRAVKPLHEDTEERTTFETELHRIEGYYERAAQRGAQLDYFLGMGVGLLPLMALAIGLAITDGAPAEMVIALAAGGVGGVLSVMSRLTSNRLRLDHEAGRSVIWLLGGIRPWVGAVFGLALFVLTSGGLLALTAVPEGVNEHHWVAGLAFLAGFIERLAPDVFDSAAAAAKGVSRRRDPPPAGDGERPLR